MVDINPANGNLNGLPDGGISDTENHVVPRIGFKARFGASVDCMADYSQPWGAHTGPGLDWAGANSNIETEIESDGFAATCSYKADLGKGQARLIGGVFYHQIGGFKDRLAAALPPERPLPGRSRASAISNSMVMASAGPSAGPMKFPKSRLGPASSTTARSISTG